VNTGINVVADVGLTGSDPNGDPLTFVIESLPHVGHLLDPGDPEGGVIETVPHELLNGGNVVRYAPPCGLSPVTSFTFRAKDATAFSNLATLTLTVTANDPHVVFNYHLSSDPGWEADSQWAFGEPTGGGTHNRDPVSGYTGPNVYGYNLNGDYTNNLPARYLSMPVMNCSNMSQVELRFWKWLGVERFDQATVEVSNDGQTWVTVWDNNGQSYVDASWSQIVLDLSTWADAQATVYVRWGMGPTDQSVTYPGWNIDDIEVWAVVAVVPADFNGDGVVDLIDHGLFAECHLGPSAALPVECWCRDMDADGDIDLADFAAVGRAFAD
jgi:hypothetical protein